MASARMHRIPEARRRELVRVAAEEFGAQGYDGASLNKVIQQCRLSKSSFYYFVPSKSALFDLVVRDLVAEIAATFDPPRPEDFEGDRFWPCAASFFDDLMRISAQDAAFMLLGRVFYKQAPDDAKRGIATVLTMIREWLENVLEVGRRAGAVRTDLPAGLQNHLIFAILKVFDEWTLDHYDELATQDLTTLASGQFAAMRRLLDPAG